ncbi:MAG: hypothetical protein HY880_07625 [Deltaproteobacteria bacterium]|nr:hypothetical protein [Deltaproteobacteria bacterium]
MMPFDIPSVLMAYLVFMAIAFGVALILWIALPFSMFGIKDLLRRSIEEQRKTNTAIAGLAEELKKRYPSDKDHEHGKEEPDA